MGAIKKQHFTRQQNAHAELFKALGHPARIAIVQYLQKQENCVCNDIVSEVGLAQATVSQHLKELKRVGLVTGTIEGRNMCYCLDTEQWNRAVDLLSNFMNKISTTQCKTC